MELIVVTLILVIFSAMIVPNMARIRDAQVARDAVPSMRRAVLFARESAITQKTTAVLAYDSSAQTLTVTQDTTVDPNAPLASQISANGGAAVAPQTAGGAAPTVTNTAAPQAADPNNPTIKKTITVPNSIDISTFQLAGQDSSAGDWQLRFYSDGSCDGGGFGFTIGTQTQSITVDLFGRPNIVDGPLPDPTTIRWEAGQFEPRSQ